MPRYDSKFFELLQLLSDYILLNLLYCAACLPVLTVGPATVALYAALGAIGRQEPWFAAFRQQFRSSFRTAFPGGIVFLICIGSLCCGLVMLYANPAQTLKLPAVILWAALSFVLAVCPIFFLFSERFSCPLLTLFRNAAFVLLAYPLRAAANLLIVWLPALLAALLPVTFLRLLMAWLLLYFSISGVVSRLLYKKPFDRLTDMNGGESAEP
ncbi:MAG: YesL family protein [Clostridia bacterium]|nr:YesL family protein [Clostridia bacterium]